MGGVVVTAVVLGLAGLAVWRILRRPKGDFCSICSCGGCSGKCGGCCGGGGNAADGAAAGKTLKGEGRGDRDGQKS